MFFFIAHEKGFFKSIKQIFDTNRIDIITVYYCVNRFLITIGDFK